jgi:hypothetical protein
MKRMEFTKTFIPPMVAFALCVSLTASRKERHIESKRDSDPFVVSVNASLSMANAYTATGSRVLSIPIEGEANINHQG